MQSRRQDDIDYFRSVQLISLNNVLKFKDEKGNAPNDYLIRRIFYYYSEKFNTALERVYQLPLHHVLTAYFEHMYEGLEPEQLDEIRQDLLKSEEERLQDQKDKDEFDAETESWMADLAKEAEAVAQKIDEMKKSGKAPILSAKNDGDVPLINPLLEKNSLPAIKINFLKPGDLKKTNDSLGLLDDLVD